MAFDRKGLAGGRKAWCDAVALQNDPHSDNP